MPITKGMIDEWMADTGSSIDAVKKSVISKSSQKHISWYNVLNRTLQQQEKLK